MGDHWNDRHYRRGGGEGGGGGGRHAPRWGSASVHTRITARCSCTSRHGDRTLPGGPAVVICSSCGTENRPGSKFCSECATPIASTCPTCGTANPPGSKFCSECATPLLATARPATSGSPKPGSEGGERLSTGGSDAGAERRLVSILFADLVGFTPFAAGARRGGGPRDADPLLRSRERRHHALRRHRGEVHRRRGDGRLGCADGARGRRRARGPGRAWSWSTRCARWAHDPGTRRRADRGGRRHPGRREPGHGRGRHRQHRRSPPVGGAPGTVLVGETMRASSLRHRLRDRPATRASRARSRPSRPGVRCGSSRRAVVAIGRTAWRRRSWAAMTRCATLKDLFHATAEDRRVRLSCRDRSGGHRQEPPRVGVHQVRRRPGRHHLVARRALARLRQRHRVLGAGGDGPRACRPERIGRRATTRAQVAATVAEHVPDPEERRWIEPALLALLGVDDRRRLRTSCSPRGARSSSGWPPARPW